MGRGCVLVVGGGIAGMSAAICLSRAGRDVELVEAALDWRPDGAGLTLNSQSLRAFAQLGILERVKAEGHCHGPTRICNAAGEPLMEPATREMTPDLPVGAGILRPVLHRIIADETLAAGVAVRLGIRVSKFDLLPDGVRVWFADGSSDEYDALVGADGLHSTIRRSLFPDAPSPTFCGQSSWRAVFPRAEEISTGTVFVGRDHRAGLNPVSNDEMYLFVIYHEPDNRYMEPSRWPELLAHEMREFGGLVGQLRETLSEGSRIIYRPLESLLLSKPWSRGHAVVIGDAVHATTPHLAYGAGLAVEDGLVLGELAQSDAPYPDIFQAFTERRFDRCRAVVEGSLRLSALEVSHAPPSQHREVFAKTTEHLWQPI